MLSFSVRASGNRVNSTEELPCGNVWKVWKTPKLGDGWGAEVSKGIVAEFLTFAASRILSAFLIACGGGGEAMRKLVGGMALLCLAIVPGAFAQGQKPAGKTYVLKAARMFDG